MANYIKTITNETTTVSVSDKGAVKLESNGRFIACLAPNAFIALASLSREELSEIFETVVSIKEEAKKTREVSKLELQILKEKQKLAEKMKALEDQMNILNQKTGQGLKVV